MEPGTAVVILLGAGAGRRLGGTEPKVFLPIGGRSMLSVAAGAAAAAPGVGELVVTYPPGWEGRARTCLEDIAPTSVTFVPGGDSRQASVRAALATIQERAGVAVVHDAARPFAAPDLFSRVLDVVDDGADAAIPVVSVTDTVVRVRAGVMAGTEPREELALAQTPQAFRTAVLREAHAKAEASGFTFTDDASVLEWAGFEVRTVPGDPANVKITTLAELAEADRRMGGEGG
jgi:2-C-methyl-D-erythritol 4-phosphate cytidylyltransferase